MAHLIGRTKNDLAVYVDLFGSEAAKHIARDPHLLSLAAELLEQLTLRQPVVTLEYDMGRTIGYDFVVQTSSTDTVFYVQQAQQDIYTRFTKNGKPRATSHLSMMLSRNDDSSYQLDYVWIGHIMPPQPGSDKETAQSKPYWENHAFVFENQPVRASTLTKTQPY